MNRSALVSVLAFVSAAALSLGVAGCSSEKPAGGGGELGSGNLGSASSSGGSSATGSSSGGQASSGGSGGSTSSGGTASASSSGGASGDDASTGSSSGTTSSGGGADGGLVMPSHGCGQGTSCTPGTDLAPPAAADGFQFVLQSGQVTIQPNTEEYYCYYKTIPGNASIEVGAFQSWMSTGASHHFITYEATSATNPDGTLEGNCPGVAGKWVYATSVSGQIIELQMPQNVGLTMAAGTQLVLNMHFVNPNSTPISPVLKLNVLYAKNVQYQAATMVSFNASIDVPPATAAGPGTQTVSGTCTAPVGSKFFAITSHTHKHATVTKVNYVSGGVVENVVDTTDWESPDVGLFYAPDFLTVKTGDTFTYSCSYSNTTSSPVLVGETAASNEMCMAIGYYFPAGTASCD
jgi:Copper type II ascorbate-dependent monooxygenase, C-terminal domain